MLDPSPSHSDNYFLDEERGGERIQITLKAAHQHGISQVGHLWPKIACWLRTFIIFQGIRTSIAEEP